VSNNFEAIWDLGTITVVPNIDDHAKDKELDVWEKLDHGAAQRRHVHG
jgi:hypothetical protein